MKVKNVNRFKLSAKDIKPDMMEATEVNIYWFAYLYLRDRLRENEECLRKAENAEDIGWCRYQVVETKKLLCELYDKLLQYPNFQDGALEHDDWVEEFLNPIDE